MADESLRYFFDNSPLLMGTVALMPDGDLLHLRDNPATCRFFGLEQGSTTGRTARGLGVPEETIALWRRHYDEAARVGGPVEFEYRHPHGRDEVCLHVTVAPLALPGPAGQPCFGYVGQDVTAARSAERALLAAEASVQQGLEAGGTVTWELDLASGRVSRSANAEGLFGPGQGPEDFLGRMPPADAERDQRMIAQVVAGVRDGYDIEYRYRHPDGRTLWLHNRARVQRAEDGQALRLHGVAFDVTSRREAEEALLRAQERLELATRASGLGVWEWNLETNEVHHSARAREIHGFAPEQPLTYDDVAARTHAEDLVHVQEMTRRAHDPELRDNAMFEYRILHPVHGLRWVRVYGQTIFDDDAGAARAVRYVGMIEDFTEQRAIEDRLTASEARLRLALNASRMAVFDWPLADPEPPLTPELREQLRIPADAASSVRARRGRYHPDDVALASRTRERALSGAEHFIDFEFRYFWPDGQIRWLQVRSEVMRDAAGRPQRLVGVQMDVTERKTGEERLELLSREVDHRANNLLAVVQSIVSLSKADDLDGLREVLLGRVTALASAHRLLANSRWSGASLAELLRDELSPYGVDDDGPVRLQGPDCALAPAEAQGLALALHELATNATKYGALSVAGGQVSVDWSVSANLLVLDWEERGGPLVVPPRRNGFGTTLLQRALGGALNGVAALEWRSTGVRCRLTLPLTSLMARDSA